uniref:putative receptor-like protein kinase At5g39000 n=1 Tax=Erigeron canadensis TaxID=72917 RepID=UPI001CB945DE|nr:putative receptor-like protein kinase At5g39000 [Erigeron canadensis]
MSQLKESQSQLKLSFKDIKVATNNFKTRIGRGGYGLVYKGRLTIDGKLTTVAVKRLNENLSQGLKEFLTEIQLLSGQKHQNLISLIGYCDEGREKILVYEYAEHGSLDRYIVRRKSITYTLTWLERLRICVAAARGLDHLHNHVGEHQTIIHRDIKSANILLDANWVAKVSDLGLSVLSLAGLGRSTVISHACGTQGYCEPEYFITGAVKKESDVYSLGMVLFEVLCGRLCMMEDDDGFVLSAESAKKSYENGNLDEIIDPELRKQMNSYSMGTFSAIAYRCLHDDRKKRPPVDLVIKELEESLHFQEEYEAKGKSRGNIAELDSEEYWKNKLPKGIEKFVKNLDSFPEYTTSKQLFMILRNGISFDLGNRVS